MFLKRFAKIQELVQRKTKDVNLEEKILRTNQIRKDLDNLMEKIKKKIKKYI